MLALVKHAITLVLIILMLFYGYQECPHMTYEVLDNACLDSAFSNFLLFLKYSLNTELELSIRVESRESILYCEMRPHFALNVGCYNIIK